MQCSDVENQMMRYVDGRLASNAVRKFETHLEVCPLCRKAYAAEVEMVAVFHADPPQAAPSGLVDDVMHDVVSLDRGEETTLGPIRIGPWAALGLAAAFLLSLVGFFMVDWSAVAQSVNATSSTWAHLVRIPGEAVFQSQWAAVHSWGMRSWQLLGSAFPSASQEHFLFIAAVTGVASLACIGLVARLRSKLIKESQV